MSARPLAAAVAFLVSLTGAATAARADVNSEACSSAYARGQEDRLAGRLFNARAAFKVCAAATCPAAPAADCKHWTAEVEADLPTIRLTANDTRGMPVANLRVSSDGVLIPGSELSRPVILEAGPHLLRFEAPGYQTLELETALRPTDRELEVHVVLQPPPPQAAGGSTSTAPHALDPAPTLALGLAGVGVVALGASAYFGLRARSQYDDLKSSCGHACTQSQADSLHAKALIADIALLTSAAAFGAAAWIYFGRDTHRSTTALSFQPHPDGAALSLRIAF